MVQSAMRRTGWRMTPSRVHTSLVLSVGGRQARFVDAKQLEHRPVAAERVDAEEAQSAHGDVDARRGLLPLLAHAPAAWRTDTFRNADRSASMQRCNGAWNPSASQSGRTAAPRCPALPRLRGFV